MANGNKSVSMAVTKNFTALVTKCKNGLLVEAAITAVGSIVMCFIIDALVSGTFYVFLGHPRVKPFLEINPKTTLELARDVAVIAGFLSGIECVMKRIREKEDILSRMVAGFRSGVIFVMFDHEPAMVVIVDGIVYALVETGISKLKEIGMSK